MKDLNLEESPHALGDLARPELRHNLPSLEGITPDTAKQWLRQMTLIRFAEETISDNVANGKIKCPCHLAIGQEAPPVALARFIKKGDQLFGAHRSHAHYLSLGGDVHKLLAEILGKETGCSKGMGGSMHLIDKENGLYGTVPIVGATIPIATGAALANKISGNKNISVSFLGDGATEEGVFQESLNLASTQNLPIIYFVENNLYASHLHIDQRQPAQSVCRFAEANNISWTRIDGNDIASLNDKLEKIVATMRENSKPHLVEIVTYRWKGHVGHRDDNDVGVERKAGLEQWKKRDAIDRLYQSMLAEEIITEPEYREMQAEIRNNIASAWSQAEQDPYPTDNALLDRVYASY